MVDLRRRTQPCVMRSKSFLILAFVCIGGCAAMARYDGELPEPDESLVRAYHAVRSAGVTTAEAGGLVFCAAHDGLEARIRDGRSSDDWSAKLEESVVRDRVRGALRADPSLRQEPIQAKLVNGEAFLSGKLSSDEQATRAVYDALKVIGVGSVHAAFITPDSPAPMVVHAVGACR
jgi:osmotically-inducible protein OsmY